LIREVGDVGQSLLLLFGVDASTLLPRGLLLLLLGTLL
jgi:hypothetical protein